MEVKDFQQNALRTESKIDTVHTNSALFDLLEAVSILSDILDGFKKQIYYNDSDKLTSQDTLNGFREVSLIMSRMVDEFNANKFSPEEQEELNPRVLHGVLGLVTETSGELVEAFLKSRDNPLDVTNVGEELFDGDWYKAVICDELGIDWNEGLEKIIKKLKARFPEGFSEERAKNRDLDSEREILES